MDRGGSYLFNPSSSSTHKSSFVSPVLRRVFSRNNIYQQSHVYPGMGVDSKHRSESRMSESTIRSNGHGGKSGDLNIEVVTDENVQFMDQPLRGRIELSNLSSPIENVSIALRGVVKTCIAGSAAWASGFGGDSNVMARFTEREVFHIADIADNRSSNKSLPCILVLNLQHLWLQDRNILSRLFSCSPAQPICLRVWSSLRA